MTTESLTLPTCPIGAPLLGEDPASISVGFQSPITGTANYATDPALIWNPFLGGADFSITGTDLASHRDLVTSITLSLFTNRRALASDKLPYAPMNKDRGGWWGDAFLTADLRVGMPVGSRLWLLARSKSSPILLQTAKLYVTEALQWLTDRKVATSLTIATEFIASDPSKLGIIITVYRRGQKPLDLTYQYVWDQVVASA